MLHGFYDAVTHPDVPGLKRTCMEKATAMSKEFCREVGLEEVGLFVSKEGRVYYTVDGKKAYIVGLNGLHADAAPYVVDVADGVLK